MARERTTPTPEPLPMGSRHSTRLMLILIGAAILAASLATPWWTRGFDINWDEDNNPRPAEAPIEGGYVNYRPYGTPGSIAGFSTDASRETATAILGVSLTLCALFAAASGAIRLGMRLGWIEENHDAPVRFAIAAFVVGVFAVLWGAFFLPLLGNNPGMLYGDESDTAPETFGDGGQFDGTETVRYANVGFFLGIVGAVGFPAFLWFDAARTRALSGTHATARATRTEVSF